MSESNTFCPANQKDWREWLKENHRSSDSVWLVYYKKASPKHNLTWSEAVDEALCFGWIDSTRNAVDEERFMQFFSKRKPQSNWSKINKEKIENLTARGMMTKAGLESVRIAKENGSWTFLDDVEAMIIPEDLENAFQQHSGSKDYFLTLNDSIKKQILYWIKSAKRPDTRLKRITEVAKQAGENKKPKQFGG